MTGSKKLITKILAVLCAGALLIGVINVGGGGKGNSSVADADSWTVREVTDSVDTRTADYFDEENVYRLTDTVTANTELSVLVSIDGQETLLDLYEAADTEMSFSEYVATPEAMKASRKVARASDKLIKKLNRSGVKYRLGNTYDTVLSGFEILIDAGDFSDVAAVIPDATLIVGEEYEKCDTDAVVTNDVNVYDTGIFDSSASPYQGDGVVVAVLDTGLDYTHSAFDVANFNPDSYAFTRDKVASLVGSGNLNASSVTAGLTVDDVYINEKVPYQFDYADGDADVFPINAAHGTHVSGIIAGNDRVITGVAPNAQIVMMKVFSDTDGTGKTSWILSAIEDCVKLGVDVINMSLGASCGFSRERDDERTQEIYDSVERAGISLLASAGNDYGSTVSSEKNGSNSLTSNPDYGTISSPASYDAAMAVASVSGIMSNYLVCGDEIIYFNEATDSSSTTRSFVDDLLTRYGKAESDRGTYEIPYEVIPGIGRSSDYPKSDYSGEIVLVKRGTTTFEEKIRIAMSKNALGIIIYNNVSGSINMSIGSNDGAAACSISQDDGEKLVAAGSGTLVVSRSQEAGPFMSEFSSWGPTSDLRIKPDITAHGGDIYSSVPGQSYDIISGTSMSSPNTAGVAALIRQYVKDPANAQRFGLDSSSSSYNADVSAIVNRLMMSTADILTAQNGLPYAVRKQGAGLVNLYSAQQSDGYITTFEEESDGSLSEMYASKIELGDDKDRTGRYEMKFKVSNISSESVRYKIDSVIQTEGVSETYTSHGDTTVTQEGYALSGTETDILSVEGGSLLGNVVEIPAGGEAVIEIAITLSDEDKEYMDESFENGMYVEGFVTLEEEGDDKVDLSVPLLAFYGDWTEAPIFDEEYYETNADELNAGLNDDDKLTEDAYATRVVGSLYDDYIAYMGTYYFVQDPANTPIAADKEHISMSNQYSTSAFTINSLYAVYAGLLRNVAEMDVEIVDDVTGKTVYFDTVYNQRKSYGTSTVYASAIDLGKFSAAENNLKNNTKYTVTVTGYLDYGDRESQNNKRNTFSFPLYIDFEAPVVTGVEFRKEYDSYTKETSLYADISIYDNHYAMAMNVGNVTSSSDPSYTFAINTFGAYATPIYSSFNSTTVVTYELTDYIDEIKDSWGVEYGADGSARVVTGNDSFIVVCYDYALNQSVYEIRLPDEVISMYFEGEGVEYDEASNTSSVTMNLNETLDLSTVLNVYPSESWVETLTYSVSGGSLVLSGHTLLAYSVTRDGDPAVVTVRGTSPEGNAVIARLYVTVTDEVTYTRPVVNSFSLTGYHVEKAFYSVSSDEREIGLTGYDYYFGSSKSLSMYPSESVTLTYSLETFFPSSTEVVFSSSNESVCVANPETGVLTAKGEGTTTVYATVYYTDEYGVRSSKSTDRISITVKDPFTTNGVYLMSYRGNGGTVEIPGDRGITTIYDYAFSGYDYIAKGEDDVIDDEDPYYTKISYLGEDTIEVVVIPEGVKEIDGYAFANLTALREVVVPSTLTNIGTGAFYGCTSLTTISFSGENNIQFINEGAFYGCTSLATFDFSSVVAVGKYAFMYCSLVNVSLPSTCQSLAAYAFAYNEKMTTFTISADIVKLDSYVFAGCSLLSSVRINAAVIPSYAFYHCTNLSYVYFGPDVSVVNEYAFRGVSSDLVIEVSALNANLASDAAQGLIYSADYKTLQVAVPYPGVYNSGKYEVTLDGRTTTISAGAFSGTYLTSLYGESVTTIEAYAFYNCTSLESVVTSKVDKIGDHAFHGCSKLNTLPTEYKTGTADDYFVVGDYAFYGTSFTSVSVPKYTQIGAYAFSNCSSLEAIEIDDCVDVGAYAFSNCVKLTTISVGSGSDIGEGAFSNSIAPDYESWYAAYGSSMDAYYYSAYISSSGGGTGGVYDAYDFPVLDEDGNVVVSAGSAVMASESMTSYYTTYFYSYNLLNASASVLASVTVGENTSIGAMAFENNTHLSSLTLSDGVTVGDYAFYNCVSLETVGNLDKVTYIGDWAFSLMPSTVDVMNYGEGYSVLSGESSMYFAYDIVQRNANGVIVGVGYRYTDHHGNLTGEIDLSSAAHIGEGAFAYNDKITSVTLGTKLFDIGAYAFYECGALESVDLENVGRIGEYAFAYTFLAVAALCDDVDILDGAFYSCEALTRAENLSSAKYIGAYAFAYTSLEEINVSNARYIGDYAFSHISTGAAAQADEDNESAGATGEGAADGATNSAAGDVANATSILSVTFLSDAGDGVLEEIGENPFLDTHVDFSITRTADVGAGVAASGTIYTETVDTYDVSGTVYVSDGVLYQRYVKTSTASAGSADAAADSAAAAGSESYEYPDGDVGENTGEYVGDELVSYPMDKIDKSYTVCDGTVRISANAFAYNEYLETVFLSSQLGAIGDKAFYGCTSLAVVVFTSYYAPILEEEYDEDYQTYDNIPLSGYYSGGYEGLGVVDYFMWSLTGSNFFYGANFVDYIGKIENKLVMVAPSNGKNYDSFTYAQYFDVVVDGALAATSDTLAVIALIATIPDRISLDDEETIVTAREMYDALSLEQKTLVSNYDKLTGAEQTLRFLQNEQSGSSSGSASADIDAAGEDGFFRKNWIGLTIALVVLIAFAAYLLATCLPKRKASRVAAEGVGDTNAGDAGTEAGDAGADASGAGTDIGTGPDEVEYGGAETCDNPISDMGGDTKKDVTADNKGWKANKKE